MFVLESVSFNRKNALSLLTLCASKCVCVRVCVCVCVCVRVPLPVSVCWTMVNGYTLAPRELSKRLNVCLKIDSAPSRVKWTCCERRTQRTICWIESRGVTSNGGSALLGSADGDAPWVFGRKADTWCTHVRFYKRRDTGKDSVWCTAFSLFLSNSHHYMAVKVQYSSTVTSHFFNGSGSIKWICHPFTPLTFHKILI